MEFLSELFPVILYFLLCILVVVSIILIIRVIKTIEITNELLTDITNKSKKLDSIFNTIDMLSSSVSSFGDKFVKFLTKSLKTIFKNRKEEKDSE